MAIFIPNIISRLEPKSQNSVRSQSQHRTEGIKQHALTSSGDGAEQAAFDRVEFRAIRRVMRHADRYCKVVDHALEVFLEQMLVTTVTASAIAQEQDR